MSAIETTNPLGSESLSQGASRLREFRAWLHDAWAAFVNGYQDGSVAGDPGTSNGTFNLSSSAPSSPAVGNFYGDTSVGLLYGYKTGPTRALMGDLEQNTITPFIQASAPTGWTRDSTFQDTSMLRYLASGNPSQGGTLDPASVAAHTKVDTPTLATTQVVGRWVFHRQAGTPAQKITDHPALLYADVILATRGL